MVVISHEQCLSPVSIHIQMFDGSSGHTGKKIQFAYFFYMKCHRIGTVHYKCHAENLIVKIKIYAIPAKDIELEIKEVKTEQKQPRVYSVNSSFHSI